MVSSTETKDISQVIRRSVWALLGAWSVAISLSLLNNQVEHRGLALDMALIEIEAAGRHLMALHLDSGMLTLPEGHHQLADEVIETAEKEHGGGHGDHKAMMAATRILGPTALLPDGAKPIEKGHHDSEGKGHGDDFQYFEAGGHLHERHPLTASAHCTRCHPHTGARNGELLGYLTGHVPLHPFLAEIDDHSRSAAASHGVLWLLGLAAIHFGGRRLERHVCESRHARAEVRFMESFDRLTGLPNRSFLRKRLDHALVQQIRSGDRVATLHLEIDRFQSLNQTLGHDAVETLISEFALLLTHQCREHETLARLDGGAFALVIPQVEDERELATRAGQMVKNLTLTTPIGGQEIFLSASIGIALAGATRTDSATLLQNAQAALRRAQSEGAAHFSFFDPDNQRMAQEMLHLENALRRALDANEFELLFQPQVDALSKRVAGAEVLVRWRRDNGDYVSPERFIPLAEQSGLIAPLTRWTLLEACRNHRAWLAKDLPPAKVAVNISARMFHAPDLAETVARILQDTGIDPRHLELEITEGAIMRDIDRALDTLKSLKKLGIKLSIDDFGTGYSSLSYLKRFPVDILKIDRSFISGIPESRDDLAIVSAVTSLAHSLDLEVIGEGVETEMQEAVLLSLRCNVLQGYRFGRPMTSADFEQLLRQDRESSTDSFPTAPQPGAWH